MSKSAIKLNFTSINANNLGDGIGLFDTINPSNTINLKSLSGGTNISLIENNGTITISSSASGGGGTSYIFNNGLTETGGTVSLGGTLTGDTSIVLNGNNILFTPSNNNDTSKITNSFIAGDNNTSTVSVDDISIVGNGNSICSTSVRSLGSFNVIKSGSTYSVSIGNGNFHRDSYRSITIGNYQGVINAGYSIGLGGCVNGSNIGYIRGATAIGFGSSSNNAYSVAIGNASTTLGEESIAISSGFGTTSFGNGSVAIGFRANACSNCSIAIGNDVKAGGLNSINISRGGSETFGIDTTILGGFGNSIQSGNTNATLVGGNNINLTGSPYIDHTVVGDLAIYETPSGGAASDDVLVRDSFTGIIKSRTQSEVASASDERLKTIINPISSALDGVIKLNGYEYKFNDLIKPKSLKGKSKYGLIAQDIEKYFPYVVKDDYTIDNVNYKSVKYNELVPILVEAIKGLNIKIDNLEKKVIDLKN